MKQIAAVIAALTIIITLPACRKDNGEGRVFKYDISGNPDTLDPQQSEDPNADTIIANMFMGLVTTAQDGSLQSGVAESWSISEDGLTYSFKLRDDVYWTDREGFEAQCTANDFVFGFRRLFQPETEAPRVKDFYCIKNGKLINQKSISDSRLLGVTAKSDLELEITLESPNPRLLSMLSEPPAMPCHEEYFTKSRGKYGLSAECTPSNGAFYLESWTYNAYNTTDINNLILRKHAKNAETRTISPSGLNFFIEDEERFIPDFKGGDISCLAVSNNDRSQLGSSYTVHEFSNITCGLAFNSSFTLFKNENFRRVLCMLIDREAIMNAIPEYEKAEGIVPKQVSMEGVNYRELAGGDTDVAMPATESATGALRPKAGAVTIPEHNVKAATDLYKSISPQLDKSLFTGAKVIVPDSAAQTAVSYIMQEWQRELGFYCKVETLSEGEYARALKNGDFDIAVLELSGKYNSPSAYLGQFSSGDPGNYTRFYNAELENFLNRAESAKDSQTSAEMFLRAEQTLIDRCAFYPLYYKNEYFFTNKKARDIIYNPFTKTVNFSQAKQKK